MATTKPAAKKAAPKKTAATKAAPDESIVVDLSVSDELTISDDMFDAWSPEQEEAAIQAAAAAADVNTIIIEGKIFAGRFPDGTIVKAPLTFSVSDLEAITAENDNPVDQLKALFIRIGDEASAAELKRLGLASVVVYAERFFSTFARITEAAMGKSLNS